MIHNTVVRAPDELRDTLRKLTRMELIRTLAAWRPGPGCRVSPVPASSGKTTCHRLNRGDDRAANNALHTIAIGRLRTDPRIKAYVARRVAEGHSKLKAIQCLKRCIARDVFPLISQRRREITSVRFCVSKRPVR